MSRTLARFLIRTLTLLAFVAGTAGIGFAHKIDRQDAALGAFLAVGGSIDDICNGDHDHDGQAGCDACRLVAAAVLPSPALPGAPVLTTNDIVGLIDKTQVHRVAFDHAHAVRAPPAV